MTIIAADSDSSALAETVKSLRQVFPSGEIITFTDAMSTYKYCLNNARDIAVAFISIILRPFDGLKLCELLATLPVPVRVVFTPMEKSAEVISLVQASGSHGYIKKPVTPKALAEKARELTEGCLTENCLGCTLFWCDNRKGEGVNQREKYI